MASLIVNDVVQVAVQGLLAGRPCVNVFHVDASRPINGNAESIAAKVLGAFQDRLVPLFSVAYNCTGATYIDLDSLSGDSGSIGPIAGEPSAGTQGSGASPQVATLVRKNVTGSPRGVSFRMFLPPTGDASISDAGILLGTYLTSLQEALDAFRSDVDEEDGPGVSRMNLCAVSYPRNSAGLVTGPGTAYDITNFSVMEKVATQRRRLRG